MPTYQLIVTVNTSEMDDVKIAQNVNHLYRFAKKLFPETQGHKNSPINVSLKIISENEQQEGLIKP